MKTDTKKNKTARLVERLSQDLWISCPFCGECDGNLVQTPKRQYGPWHVACNCCGAEGPTAKTPQEALAQWNDRAEPFIPDDWAERNNQIRRMH